MCVLNHKVSVGSICKRTGYGKLTRHCYLDQSTHSVHRSTPCMGIKELVKKQYLCVCVCVCVHMRVCMCVPVKSQSQCGSICKLIGYGIRNSL